MSSITIDKIIALQGDKYSPNLRKWLVAWKRKMGRTIHALPDVFRTSTGLYIGFVDPQFPKELIGSKLNGTLCNGAKESIYCFPLKDGLVKQERFWSEYSANGRCAIDLDHRMRFIGDEGRWSAREAVRTCNWCRHQQVKLTWTETITQNEWVSA